MTTARSRAGFGNAIPFWISLAQIPVVIFAATHGGWALILPVASTLGLFAFLDEVGGLNLNNIDTETPDSALFWHRLITLIWMPIQVALIFSMIWYTTHSNHLGAIEKVALFFGVGQLSGAVGIVYAHELMHQKNRTERLLADILLAMAVYGHFRSEHLLVHHTYVATPKDPVTARYNENFHRFFFRVLHQSWRSAFRAERALLARKKLPWWNSANPFWRYWTLQAGFLSLAMIVGGWVGLGLFLFQASVAIWYLELTNYVEHYGLTRKHLGAGKYEPTKPQHSWNAAHRASNWFLINLQRHSDHHAKPNRRYPVLQNIPGTDAPQLPSGYPVMVVLALIPPVWRRMMNPQVRKWRAMYYPEITDWLPYKNASNPPPR